MHPTKNAKTGRKHHFCRLLSKQTFRRILETLPPNIEIRALSPVRVYHDLDGNWKKLLYGAVALVKDYNIRRFCIYVVSLPDCQRVFSANLYANFDYYVDHKYFHQYRTELNNDECHFGLHFPNGSVANRDAFKLAENVIQLLKKSGDIHGMSRFFEDVYSPNGSPDYYKNDGITLDAHVYSSLSAFESCSTGPTLSRSKTKDSPEPECDSDLTQRNCRRNKEKRSDTMRRPKKNYDYVEEYAEEQEESDEGYTDDEENREHLIKKRGRRRSRPATVQQKNSFENESVENDNYQVDRGTYESEGKKRGKQKEKFWAGIRNFFGALGKDEEEESLGEPSQTSSRMIKKPAGKTSEWKTTSQQSFKRFSPKTEKLGSKSRFRFE